MSLGFGVVQSYLTEGQDRRKRVLANAVYVSLVLCLGVFGIVQLVAPQIIAFLNSPTIESRWALNAMLLWVAAQSFYHVVLAYERALHSILTANVLMLSIKSVLLIAISLFAWLSGTLSVAMYFGIVGGVAILIVSVFVYRLPRTWGLAPDVLLARDLVRISSSRCVDSLLRHSFMPVLLTLLYSFGEVALAGMTTVATLLIRGVESLFQPLVLMVLADGLSSSDTKSNRERVQAAWDISLLASIPMVAFLLVAAPAIIGIWLGDRYGELEQVFRLMSLAFPALLSTVLLRGYLDSQYRFSPLAITGLIRIAVVSVAIPALYFLDCLSVTSVVTCVVATYWLQAVIIYCLLQTKFAVRPFSGAIVRQGWEYWRRSRSS